MRDMLNKELAADNIVLMDRYFWSHIAYSAARGMDENASAMIGMGLPVPDLTVFLDADPEVVAQRGGYGLERFENIDFQRHVSSAMRKLAQKFPDSTTRIDAHQEIEFVTTQILLHLKI
jgi:dTMP kinase